MKHLKSFFKKHPVIAAVCDEDDLEQALKTDVIALFILSGSITDISRIMEAAYNYDKLVFLHIDLMDGIASDKAGIEYLAQNSLCDGIITTRNNLIKHAQQNGLMAVQRLFLIDSAALHSGENMIKHNNPDAIEILPGIAAPYFIEHVSEKNQCPVIAGGLIREKEEIESILNSGVMAVSSSDQNLWKLKA